MPEVLETNQTQSFPREKDFYYLSSADEEEIIIPNNARTIWANHQFTQKL